MTSIDELYPPQTEDASENLDTTATKIGQQIADAIKTRLADADADADTDADADADAN